MAVSRKYHFHSSAYFEICDYAGAEQRLGNPFFPGLDGASDWYSTCVILILGAVNLPADSRVLY